MRTIFILVSLLSLQTYAAICSCDAPPECGSKPSTCFTTAKLECPGKTPGYSFKIESQETIKSNAHTGTFNFPENAAVNMTETFGGFTRQFTGQIIFQNVGNVLIKHGRIAHYIFKLSESNQPSSPFKQQVYSLVMSINGIDDFENRIECFWL